MSLITKKYIEMIRHLSLISLTALVLAVNVASGQSVISGRVVDALSGKPLQQVNIVLQVSNAGTVSGLDGNFSIAGSFLEDSICFSALGYKTKILALSVNGKESIDLGNIYLESALIALEEVNIISTFTSAGQLPVSVSTISGQRIESQIKDQPFPDVIKMVPGVYSSRTGGGSGDAEVNIRGFQQENIGLLLNGVPISSVENGLIYWNNWTGLADIARSVQVQRGLGASNVALNSVGGTINIVTKTTDAVKGGFIDYSSTSYGNSKISLGLSTGLLNGDYSVSFLGSRTTGPGYVDGTYVDGWAYFLSVSKRFSTSHTLVLTALGAPEKHGQRNLKLSSEEIDQYGLKFNKDWGSYNGRINNTSENFYHKPWITLNHYWNINPKMFLASSLYISPGSGGGKWSDVYSPNDPTIFEFRNPSGQIDWEAIYQNNSTHTDTVVLTTGERVSGFSKNVQTHFLAGHSWNGLISRFEYKIDEPLKLTAGIHLRQFRSSLKQKLTDLLGGDFYIDDYAWAIEGAQGRNPVKSVGDIIKVHNGAINPSVTFFGQIDYHHKNFNAFFSSSLTSSWYQRWDKYNYVNDVYSEVIRKSGFDVKTGVSYSPVRNHRIYANAGYFSRVPYHKYIFGNFSNVPTRNISNERVESAEIGYEFSKAPTYLRLNGYLTVWQDKNFLSNEYIQLENSTSTRALVTGLDARHSGIEAEIEHQLTGYLKLGGILSSGNWKWKNDVSAVLFNDNNTAVDTVNVYANGLYVGGTPQFIAGLTGNLMLLRKFSVSGNWIYYDKHYASFDPALRSIPGDRSQAFKIPAYSVLDLHVDFPFLMFEQQARFSLSCYNVLNDKHIIRGEDGLDHSSETFRGFWGFGRTFSFSLRISFQ